MASVRRILFALAAAGALYGVQACTSETELNPQPLPPGPEDPAQGARDSENSDGKGTVGGGASSSGGSSSGSSGSSGTSGSPAPNPDGGTDGDAADGGGG